MQFSVVTVILKENCYKEFRYFLENTSFHFWPKSQAYVKQC